jgi:hypothetical protein
MHYLHTFMMSIEVPWFCIMIGGVLELFSCLNVKITTFELEKTTFVVYLIIFSPIYHPLSWLLLMSSTEKPYL